MYESLCLTLDSGRLVSLLYREGTSDLETIREVLERQPYDLSRSQSIARRRAIEEEYDLILAAGDEPLIVDAGANVGASAIYFATRYPEARILAIEPDEANFRLLQLNTRNYRRVSCVHGAVASRDGMAEVIDPGLSTDGYRATLIPAAAGSIGQVPAYSVPSLLEQATGARPLLLKVDIEGGESDLFSGMPAWLEDFPVIAIELHDWLRPGEGTSTSFLGAVAAARRDVVINPGTDILFALRNSTIVGTEPGR
jgi:FkbM family methyltransferase